MLKNKISIIILILLFILSTAILIPQQKLYRVEEVVSPSKFKIDNKIFEINNINFFDTEFTAKNKALAKSLNITEEDAFILGNLTKYWAENLMKNRFVYIKNNSDLIYLKYSYKGKFLNSGYCLIESKPYSTKTFQQRLTEIKRANYHILDLKTNKIYKIDSKNIPDIEDFIILRKSHLPKQLTKPKSISKKKNSLKKENISIFLTDSTTKLYPDRNCSSEICQQILNNINNSEKSIDIAIYGYSTVPEIENALKNAINRGVKIRLIYDTDEKGFNIYPNTNKIISIIPENKNDFNSIENKSIMHNKFYIFDEKILITGSANLSHTDMSGFNSNNIVVIKSEEIAQIYKKEFEQMYNGKFHNDKVSIPNKKLTLSNNDIQIYFSPQDKPLKNAIIPLIDNAKKYIYIPTFLLTDYKTTSALINAHKRGVEIKIIIDALNASIKHSKHNELRTAGILVKSENYAGKMHNKSMIIDDEYTIVGSMNFSYSGDNRNDENLLIIKNPEIAKFYKDFFLYQWQKIDDKYLKINVRAEGKYSIGSCSDSIDNNYDGLIDNEDLACK